MLPFICNLFMQGNTNLSLPASWIKGKGSGGATSPGINRSEGWIDLDGTEYVYLNPTTAISGTKRFFISGKITLPADGDPAAAIGRRQNFSMLDGNTNSTGASIASGDDGRFAVTYTVTSATSNQVLFYNQNGTAYRLSDVLLLDVT